ncbi:phage neck terminator protein [Apilactobacillus timberlakei]|uniref:Tail completion protein n=2 Tax=Apilactobacillus timberlakei TaxID=2008380 RepID=A0ABY2YT22_9LACO|nr:hypothetical protein [Apilactobacillus timberlakei]TPR12738.1 hypothetical protein DY048_06930 [Apilactobacillus timberlakei]TPR13621.1 hypothetical protein DY052_07800 [Apilactobacillus timberlakei]
MYSAKTFNWGAFYGQLRHTIEDITGFDGEHVLMDYSDKKVSYPYVTVSQPNRSNLQASSIGSRNKEIADYLIQINCYSTNGNDTMQMADDIATLLFDPLYKSKFHQYGVVINDINNSTGAVNDFSNLFNVNTSTITLKITAYRNYASKINKINSVDTANTK